MPALAPRRGPGVLADSGAPSAIWSGRKSAEYVRLTLATYGSICWLCGLPGADSADHIIPRSRGGAVYDIRNLGPSHRACNTARSNRPLEVYRSITDGMDYFTKP